MNVRTNMYEVNEGVMLEWSLKRKIYVCFLTEQRGNTKWYRARRTMKRLERGKRE